MGGDSCGAIRARSCCSWAKSLRPGDEWSEARELDWHHLDHPMHVGVKRLVAGLNAVYRASHALYCESEGFQWLASDENAHSVFAWLRRSGADDPPVAVVANFMPVARDSYVLPLPAAGRWREVVNTDASQYAGRARATSAPLRHTPVRPADARPRRVLGFLRSRR